MPRNCDPKHALLVLGLAASLTHCSREQTGEVDGRKFVRCAQRKPSARSYRAGPIRLAVEGRTLAVEGTTRIAAFTGPVGRSLAASDVAQIEEGELVLWLGGLGDTLELAQANLARVAARRAPTVFVAGGADRASIVDKAFAALPEEAPIVEGSGLRQLRVGGLTFAVAAGAPAGRYAIDEGACGLTPEDLRAIEAEAGRCPLLLSWHASRESVELSALARALGAAGGLWAFPSAAGPDVPGSEGWAVPRLGLPGTLRGDGARLAPQVGHFVLDADGLRRRP